MIRKIESYKSIKDYNECSRLWCCFCCMFVVGMVILIILVSFVGFPLAAWFAQSSTWTSGDLCGSNNDTSNCTINCDCAWCFNDTAKHFKSWYTRFDEEPGTCTTLTVETKSCPASYDGYYIVGASLFAILSATCSAILIIL